MTDPVKMWRWVDTSERRCWVCGVRESGRVLLVIDRDDRYELTGRWVCISCRSQQVVGRPA